MTQDRFLHACFCWITYWVELVETICKITTGGIWYPTWSWTMMIWKMERDGFRSVD